MRFPAAVLIIALVLTGCSASSDAPIEGPSGGDASSPTPDEAAPSGAVSRDIHPGTRVVPATGECTSGFLLRDVANGKLYLTTSANCMRSAKLNATVSLADLHSGGRLVYRSLDFADTDPTVAQGNDLALIEVAFLATHRMASDIVGVGVPSAMANSSELALGAQVSAFVNSSLRSDPGGAGRDPGAPKVLKGVVIDASTPWGVKVYLDSPILPGDYGGGLLDEKGNAIGWVNGVHVLPRTGSTQVPGGVAAGSTVICPLDMALERAFQNAGFDLQLVTEPL